MATPQSTLDAGRKQLRAMRDGLSVLGGGDERAEEAMRRAEVVDASMLANAAVRRLDTLLESEIPPNSPPDAIAEWTAILRMIEASTTLFAAQVELATRTSRRLKVKEKEEPGEPAL